MTSKGETNSKKRGEFMAQKKKRPTAKERRNGFIINVLTLIVLILLVFEGKSLISLFSSQTIQERIKSEESEVFAGANLTEAQSEVQTEAGSEKQTDASSAQSEASTEAQTDAVVTDLATGLPNDDASYLDVVVPAQETPVDDSYSISCTDLFPQAEIRQKKEINSRDNFRFIYF